MPNWLKIFLPILSVLILFSIGLVFIYVFTIGYKLPVYTTISGESMYPTLKNGENVDLKSGFVNPEPGDIIVFNYSGVGCEDKHDMYVKRLIDIDKNGNYWVEGDNKSNSCDSRTFGWISPNGLIGVVK